MRKLLAAISTACIAAIAWPANGSLTPLIFGAFIPMLWLERSIRLDERRGKGRRVFLYAWLCFGLFNLLTTWWVAYAHWSGTVATTIMNGGLMAFCFWLYFKVSQQIGENKGALMLPFLWMLVEYLHMDWDMSFPWLNLGYVFANRPTWIQWYSITGIWGGTLWVWWVNVMFFRVLKDKEFEIVRLWSLITRTIVLILLPIGISYYMYQNYEQNGPTINVVVVQPNLDPYTEKFNYSDLQTTERFLALATPYVTDSTDYLIGPETMIGKGLQESTLKYHNSIDTMNKWIDAHPRSSIVIGATTYSIYDSPETPTARSMRDGIHFYDSYNSSLQLNGSNQEVDIYHKSKLVVGVEKVPFAWLLKPLLKDGIDLGGATGTLGGQEDREVFRSESSDIVVGTPVCWEADFPGYTSEFVRNGANVLFAITNDGWWDDTPGKDQHLHYARIRAIENRRDIARSANTGISCIINQRGDVSHEIPYEETGAFAAQLRLNSEITIFSSMGDLIGRIAVFLSAAVVLSVFVRRKTSLKK